MAVANEAFRQKLEEEEIIEAVADIMEESSRFREFWPKDLPSSVGNRIKNAFIFKGSHRLCLAALGREMETSADDIRVFDCSSMSFIVVGGYLKAITMTYWLREPDFPPVIMIAEDRGVPWEPLRELAHVGNALAVQ